MSIESIEKGVDREENIASEELACLLAGGGNEMDIKIKLCINTAITYVAIALLPDAFSIPLGLGLAGILLLLAGVKLYQSAG